MEAKLDELRMDLLKVVKTSAFGEEGKTLMGMEELVGRVKRAREEV